MLNIGMIVDNRYKILRELGRGGTSCVFLAENIKLHSFWAIKEVFKNSRASNGMASNMLVTESSILTRLRHPGLPTIIDVIDTPYSYLIVMEYIEGVSLDKVISARGACSQEEVIKWGRQLCDVLGYLHSQQPSIIYRDMKPGNIMLKPDGNVVLIDFGMAREFKRNNSHDTSLLGTHGYAAPEQYDDNRQSDARTDIYSLGVTLYHLVTGCDPCIPPYGINPLQSIDPSLSYELDRIIQRCTQLQPEYRFQSAQEMDRALESIGQNTQYDYDQYTESPAKSKAWMWVFAVIPVVLILIVVAVVAGVNSSGNGQVDVDDYNYGYGYSDNDSNEEDLEDIVYENVVYITEDNYIEYFVFEAPAAGYYNMFSVSENNVPYILIYDKEMEYLDEVSGDYIGFDAVYWLEEGEEYSIEVSLYADENAGPQTGMFVFYVDYLEEY